MMNQSEFCYAISAFYCSYLTILPPKVCDLWFHQSDLPSKFAEENRLKLLAIPGCLVNTTMASKSTVTLVKRSRIQMSQHFVIVPQKRQIYRLQLHHKG
jgi:hypothetical protein